jgi:choline dehydrogenase-like flavoprotein
VRHDARDIPAGTRLETDICIVGGGVAGTVLARELRRGDVRVCILESGGVNPDPATQDLADGDVLGEPTNPLITTRQRQLGGSANLWDSHLNSELVGFRCAPLDAVDFEKREGVPDSGWPFDRSHLDPYYERAQEVCGLGPYEYEAAAWAGPEAPLFPVTEHGISTTVWQFGCQDRFVRDYPDELARAPDVMVLLNANVTAIVAAAAGTAVTGVRVKTLEGRTFEVAAGIVILAAGGIENARLLLLSDALCPQGLGNDHDLVGRYFMEHPFVFAGRLAPRSRAVFDRAALYDVTPQNGTTVMANMGLPEAVLRHEGLLNSRMLLLPVHGVHKPESIDSLKLLLRALSRGRPPERWRSHLQEVARGLDFVGVSVLRKLTGRKKLFRHIDWGPGITRGAGWSNQSAKTRRYSAFDAYLLTEQPPLRDNRVRLGEKRDALGCRRLELFWHWDEFSRRSVARTERLLAAAFRRSGFGRLDLRFVDGQPVLQYPAQHHHLGTTRMHPDPKRGVVDPHGRVHGLANLFVAGGSVFPTGGCINPTLTIVALALRLADHVLSRTQRPALEFSLQRQ